MKIILEKQLQDQYIQSWNLEINRNRKCVIYRVFVIVIVDLLPPMLQNMKNGGWRNT